MDTKKLIKLIKLKDTVSSISLMFPRDNDALRYTVRTLLVPEAGPFMLGPRLRSSHTFITIYNQQSTYPE